MKLTATVVLLLLLFAISCKKDKQPKPQLPALSSNKDITEFTFNLADNPDFLTNSFIGTITNDTILFTLPAGNLPV